jgi:RimJ/RimL family protein N-acetyltransferase
VIEPSDMSDRGAVRIVPWGNGDLALLQKLVGAPAMMEHLGGPESPEKIAARQARYARGDSGMFKIVDEATGDGVGSVGYWDRSWRGAQVYEVGWSVLPRFQGRGIAGSAAARVVVMAAAEGRHPFVHTFPSVDNGPSNAISRKLGFTLLEECELEYPPGRVMRCSDWRLHLAAV